MIGDPMPVNRIHTLENFLKAYKYRAEDVCVNEFIANAMDAFKEYSVKNGAINISFEQKSGNYYLIFHNNAPPMNKELFSVKYHKIAESTKRPGDSIGFAGVGAKVFLVATPDGEIITITGENNKKFYASIMHRTLDDLTFATSIKYTLKEIIGNLKIEHKYGTASRIKLSKDSYKYLKENIVGIIQFWFNYALINNMMDIFVEFHRILHVIYTHQQKFLPV